MTTIHFGTTKPIALWNRAIQTDFKTFFLNLAEGALHLTTHEWKEAASNALEALSAIGLAPDDCGARAWLLIHRALTEAVFQLAEESALSSPQPLIDPESWVASLELDQTLEQHPFSLDPHFFLHPERCPLLAHLDRPLRHWLEANGHDPARARAISQRLPSYFVCALNHQWRKKPEEYLCLQQVVETPFTQAAEREQGWNHYRAWLQKQVDEPLLGGPFSLRTLHIPLRGGTSGPCQHHTESGDWHPCTLVVDLHTALMDWVHEAHPGDAVRLLCGGAGTGKTTSAKLFAAAVAGEGTIPVLFIPFHLLPGPLDLVQAVKAFVAADPYCHRYSPLEEREGQERLLLILDGLEEWAMHHAEATVASRQFVEAVWQTTDQFNQRESRLQVLITERTPLCCASTDLFRLPGQMIHLLSYHPEGESHGQPDPDPVWRVDQRPLWWAAYAQAKGEPESDRLAPFQMDELAEISAHPLINHLLALWIEEGRPGLTQEKGCHLFYQEVLSALFKRSYAGGRNPATRGLEEVPFARLLEAVATAVWHGHGWTATITEMETYCRPLWPPTRTGRPGPGSREDIVRLLTAFCFRMAGFNPSGEEAFAFLHHRFAEFFVARRVVRLLHQMSNQLKRFRANSDQGWSETTALLHWLDLCGPTELDEGIFLFLGRELALYSPRTVWGWQKQVAHLLGHLLKSGLPMARRGMTSHKRMEREARHAELALLAVLNGAARHTGRRSPRWVGEATAFGSWLHRLRRQRTLSDPGSRALAWLGYLDLSGVVLRLADLFGADLQNTDLRGADLYWANLGQANLQGADLRGANLEKTNLEGIQRQHAKGLAVEKGSS